MQTLLLQEGRKQDLIAFSLYFQKIMMQKIPPGGGGGFALLAISLYTTALINVLLYTTAR